MRIQLTDFGRKVRNLALTLTITVPFLTGCWDRVEIEQRATILGLAVDIPEGNMQNNPLDVTHPPDSANTPPKVLLTAHVAVPGRIPLGPTSGGGGGGGGDSGKAIWTVQAVGEDIADALTNLQQQVAERLFLGHLRIIIVSDEFAKQGLTTANDYFRRSSEIRRTTWLVVSQGRAEKIMEMSPPLERVPTLYLLATMDRAKDSGKLPNDFVGNFWTLTTSDGQEGFLPYVSVKQENNLKIEGLAYFQGTKMVGTTTAFQIIPFMEITGENPAGYSVPIQLNGSTVVVTAFRRLARIHTDVVNGQPVARISMHVDTNISEKDGENLNLQDPRVVDTLEQQINSAMERSSLALIRQTQQDHADIFGFGEDLRAKHSSYWKTVVRDKPGWEKIYPNLKVEIHSTSRVHRMGMKDE